MALLSYNAIAMLTLLALQTGELWGATAYEWVSTLGIAGSLLFGFLFWYFRVKEPRDAKDNKDDIERLIAATSRETERVAAAAMAQQATWELFLEKTEKRHKEENEVRAAYHKADMDRAHETFRGTMESTMARLDVYNRTLSDVKIEIHDLSQRLPRS